MATVVRGAVGALSHASSIASPRRRARVLPVRPAASLRRGRGTGRGGNARDRGQRRKRDALSPHCARAVRGRDARALLARGLRRRRFPPVPRRDERTRDVWRRPLPARHGEGRRPRRRRRHARARLQLRVQSLVRVGRPVGVSARATGEPIGASHRRGRAGAMRRLGRPGPAQRGQAPSLSRLDLLQCASARPHILRGGPHEHPEPLLLEDVRRPAGSP